MRKRRNISWIQFKTEYSRWHDGQNGVSTVMMMRRKRRRMMMIMMMNVKDKEKGCVLKLRCLVKVSALKSHGWRE